MKTEVGSQQLGSTEEGSETVFTEGAKPVRVKLVVASYSRGLPIFVS